jgi:predicted transcriptional regulator
MAIEIMKKAHINGDFLPWYDFLHEGPVPKTLSIHQLSNIRADFISRQGFGFIEQLRADFQKRDKKLEDYHKYKKIILWFEHDLYDQLQLIQVLSWFSVNNDENIKLGLISTHHYIGECSKEEIIKLLHYEEKITKEHLNLAHKAWLAFQEPNPLVWFNLLDINTENLPFLENAIKRMIEEFPNTKNGLSRSAHQALLIISKGINNPREIFNKCQNYEKQKFMGDIIFWKILDELVENDIISSQKNGQILKITELGQEVLNGKINYLHIKPINRWIGGTKLTNDKVWCWNIKKRTIHNYYYSHTLSSLLAFK